MNVAPDAKATHIHIHLVPLSTSMLVGKVQMYKGISPIPRLATTPVTPTLEFLTKYEIAVSELKSVIHGYVQWRSTAVSRI